MIQELENRMREKDREYAEIKEFKDRIDNKEKVRV